MKHLKEFENDNNEKYMIISDNHDKRTYNDMKVIYVYKNDDNLSNFEYIDTYKDNNRTAVLYTLEDAKIKIKDLEGKFSTNKFKYVTIEELNQLIKDIEIKNDADKYNL